MSNKSDNLWMLRVIHLSMRYGRAADPNHALREVLNTGERGDMNLSWGGVMDELLKLLTTARLSI